MMTNDFKNALDAVTLGDMWESNESLHERFLGKPAELSQALAARDEEVAEFTRAAIYEEPMNAAEEAADELFTVIGVLRAAGVTREMFLMACQQVIAKNNAKTHETHYVNESGKIQRKGRE